jgi:hypothetical protein
MSPAVAVHVFEACEPISEAESVPLDCRSCQVLARSAPPRMSASPPLTGGDRTSAGAVQSALLIHSRHPRHGGIIRSPRNRLY